MLSINTNNIINNTINNTKHSCTYTFIYYYKYNMKNQIIKINNELKKSKSNKNIMMLR